MATSPGRFVLFEASLRGLHLRYGLIIALLSHSSDVENQAKMRTGFKSEPAACQPRGIRSHFSRLGISSTFVASDSRG